MTLIEGIGDEVTTFFSILLVCIIGALAWWSTGIAHRPIIRTVLIFEHRARSRMVRPVLANTIRSQTSTLETQSRSSEQSVNGSSAAVEAVGVQESETAATVNAQPQSEDESQQSIAQSSPLSREEAEQNAILETMDSDSCTIRKRRIAFFQSKKDTVVEESQNNTEDKPQTSSIHKEETDNIVNERTDENTNPSVEDSRDSIRIKLKYLNDDLKLVQGKLQERLGDFKRRHFAVELAAQKLVRLIFNGHVLARDTETLQSCGLFDNCVVHCLVHQPQQPQSISVDSSGEGIPMSSLPGASRSEATQTARRRRRTQRDGGNLHWDLGNVLFALISFILSGAWYFRYEYAQLFTVTATVGLVGLTVVFTFLFIGLFFPEQNSTQNTTNNNSVPNQSTATTTT